MSCGWELGLRTFPCDISWIAERNKLVQVKQGKNIKPYPLFFRSITMFWPKTKCEEQRQWASEGGAIPKERITKDFWVIFHFNVTLFSPCSIVSSVSKIRTEFSHSKGKTKQNKTKTFSKAVCKNNCCNPNFCLVLV